MERLDTGIFATALLADVLFREGHGKLICRLMEASFRAMRENGGGTLWEVWEGKYSHNHPMYGGIVSSLFTYVLGIRQKSGSVGFTEVEIAPMDILGIDWAEGSITTPGGVISVRYRRQADGTLKVESHMR